MSANSVASRGLMAGFLVVIVSAVVAINGNARLSAADDNQAQAAVKYDSNGRLLRLEGYRRWPFIGTPVTPNELNNGDAPFPEFHIVYMDPTSFDHYEKSGEFRDGTILVKELTSVGSKEASSGRGYFMGEYIGLEVSIKDNKRYKGEPGGWAYFSFGHKLPLKDSAAKNPAASCSDCHRNNAKQDLVFTQYYPVLRAAAPKK